MNPTPEAVEPTVIPIADWNMDALAAKFKRMAKKAAKLGCAAPTYTIVATRDVDVTEVDNLHGANRGVSHVEVWHDIVVDGEAPRLSGHRLVAVIDRDLDNPDSPNVVNTLPDVELNVAWRSVGDVCEHDACNGAARGRKKIIVVRHDDGSDRMVGSTCVADYLGGVEPSMVARFLSYADDLSTIGEEWDGSEKGRRTEYRFDLTAFLAMTAAMIRTYGWTSRGAAYDFGKTATADDVIRWFDGPKRRVPTDPDAATDEDVAVAEKAIGWARGIEVGEKCGLAADSYLANLNAVALKDMIRVKDTGVAASLISAYNRHVLGEERKAKAANSEHFGTVGKRMVVTAEVAGAYTYDSNYGVVTWITAITDDGNLVKWKSTGSSTPNRGAVITGKATVKDHAEYKGRNETVVTRWSWMMHPDHCDHTYTNHWGEITGGDRRKPGRYACERCGSPIAARDLLETLSADGLAVVTHLVWRAGVLPCTRIDMNHNVDAADRYSAGWTVDAAAMVTTYNTDTEED